MKVWIAKPVSQKPEKSGWHYCINPNGELLYRMIYFNGREWDNNGTYIAHYLVPIEVDHVLTDKELEEIKVQAWKDGFFEVKTDYIKNNKQQ